jgi:8-oxo-dGTP pyrophosphatase MutT (NUDIX family)
MGASILPVIIHNNKLYFLFGKERTIDENPGWSDFGGGTDPGETFFETACREGSEELTGFLGEPKDIAKLLKENGTFPLDYQSNGHATYRCHIFPLIYKNKDVDVFHTLPFYYNNNQKFIQKHLASHIIRDTKIFEKTEIQWFCLQDLEKKKKEFRSFYQNIIELILGEKRNIRKFVQNRNNGKHNNKKTRKNK